MDETIRRKLTIPDLICCAKEFCTDFSMRQFPEMFGVTDGKNVGTFIEHAFQKFLSERYVVEIGNSAKGIDLPSAEVCTDIKTTSHTQPQSSCPFKNAKQKIWGLGYNLLLFVYEKSDLPEKRTAVFRFVSCAFVSKERTADFQTTSRLREIVKNDGNADDVAAYLFDRNLPADETTIRRIAEEVLANPPTLGYLTISNALQWRLQYQRIVDLAESVPGIQKILDADDVQK